MDSPECSLNCRKCIFLTSVVCYCFVQLEEENLKQRREAEAMMSQRRERLLREQEEQKRRKMEAVAALDVDTKERAMKEFEEECRLRAQV
jgi:hypothetical protein